LVALGDEPGELGFCDHNPEAAPATPTGVKQHAASPRKTSPSMSDFNCRQGGIVIVVAHACASTLFSQIMMRGSLIRKAGRQEKSLP
jgi:hypothetical protein